MPVRPLDDAARARLTAFPREVPEEDLFAHFTLTGPDKALVPDRSAPPVRLGFALTLCAVRYLGFCPEDLLGAPERVLWYVGQQIGAPPESIVSYGRRAQTRSDHLRAAHAHLGYRAPSGADLQRLSGWLAERALEHDDQTLLVTLLAERMKAERLGRPALYRLERMASAAREGAAEATFRALSPLLGADRRDRLGSLLLPAAVGDGAKGKRKDRPRTGATPLSWLREGATTNTPRALLEQVGKLSYLREIGADDLDVASVNPNRLKILASLGRRYTNQALQRQEPERRYPVLLAFLKEAHTEITDEVVDLFDRLVAQADARARRELEEFRKGAARATDEKVRLFGDLGRVLLDPAVPDSGVREAALGVLGSAGELRRAVEESDRLARPADDNYFDFLADKHRYVRQFFPTFLRALCFRSNKSRDPLLEAVDFVKDSGHDRAGRLPRGAPTGFVPARWEPYVLAGPGRIDRRFWEMCLAAELRGALRSGDVWVEGARRYADPQSFLIPKTSWPALRAETGLLTGSSPDGPEHLRGCRAELEKALRGLDLAARDGGGARMQAGRLVVSRDRSHGPPEGALALGREISKRLPKVELTDLLVEVDRWTGFSRLLTHAGGAEPRTPDLRVHLYAAILAQATNIGPVRMAELADLSYQRLAWCYAWYLREETLSDAIAAVVNRHHREPLSAAWGGGTLSSSDGQRFPVDVKARNTRALPRYFGWGKGVTMYSWTSDQFTQYGTKVIPSTVRDATYVLDGILGNETELPVTEHTVDTHGYTEMVFALFGALGLRFSPRIRDIASQRLWRVDGLEDGAASKGLLGAKINEKLILRHWDDILRIAGSLKMGWVTSSLLVSRLQARPRKSGLTKALQEYGRLEKTIFLLRYAESEDLRRRIGRQLNKGEELHALRSFLFFAGEGKVRRRQPGEQGDQALCLNLLTDAVILWNTVYYQKAVATLREEGFPVRDGDLPHLSPTRHAHVNPYGRYSFDLGGEDASGDALRPLRPA